MRNNSSLAPLIPSFAEQPTATMTPTLATSAQGLLLQIQSTLGFNLGDIMMFPIDLPDATTQPATVMIVQARPTSTATETQAVPTVGICTVADASGNNGPVSINPGSSVEGYLADVEKLSNWMVPPANMTVTILEGPVHGALSESSTKGRYIYTSTSGYTGLEKATFLVDTGSRQFKLIYFIQVYNENAGDEANCNTTYWRISQSTIDAGTLADFISPSSPLNYQFTQVDVSLNIAILANGAVGETTSHNITLDDNGGGHGWFIDQTPTDNSEFLPTSNPNEWIAKAGSEAAGKMDMLSVLLHEYGHALGLEHSTNSHDFMATTLTPGVRRLPTAEELTLMAQLLAEIKTDMLAVGNTPDSPQSPFPTLPLDSIRGLALFGRLRGTR